jgi:hypothetical protein
LISFFLLSANDWLSHPSRIALTASIAGHLKPQELGDEVPLAQRHTLGPQNGVGGGDVEEEVGEVVG